MKAILKTPQKRTAQMKKVIIKQFPDLENLEVTPSAEEQVFKSEKYGFDEVKVKGVESEEITIVPSAEEQVFEGFFNKVVVEGEPNAKPENIKRDEIILGVKGTLDADPELIRSFMALIDDSLGFNISKLPSGITKIPERLCFERKNLIYLEIPTTVTSIGDYAFHETSNLLEIKLNEGLKVIGNYAFQHSGLEKINIPLTVTEIGMYVFSYNNFTSITIPEGVTEIQNNTLDRCYNLETVIIKSKTLNIGSNVFYDDRKLTKIVFENLTSVPLLKSASTFSKTPIALYSNTVGYIYVPDNLVEDFKTATNWSTYADQIKPLSELEVA